MIATLLAAARLFRVAAVEPSRPPVRRARWRGTDGQWQWAAA
jgi:hypothetical protein